MANTKYLKRDGTPIMRDLGLILSDLRESIDANDNNLLEGMQYDIKDMMKRVETLHGTQKDIFSFGEAIAEYIDAATILFEDLPPEVGQNAPPIDTKTEEERTAELAKELGYDQMGLVYQPGKSGSIQFNYMGKDALAKSAPMLKDLATNLPSYSPESRSTAPKTIKDLIIAFIFKIINYFKGILQYGVNGVTGMARKIVGLETPKLDIIFDEKAKRAKEIATAGKNTAMLNPANMSITRDKRDDGRDGREGNNDRQQGNNNQGYYRNQRPVNAAIETSDSNGIVAFLEDFGTTVSGIADKMADRMAPGSPRIAVVDISPDIYELNASVTYFFNLFDKSFGSDGEKLFDTVDLEGVYELCSSVISQMKAKFGTNIGDIGLNMASTLKTRNMTAINVENLKKAYIQISQKIYVIIDNIAAKHAEIKTASGIANRMYSAQTYEELSKTLKFIDPRVKSVSDMAKELDKMQAKFDKLHNDFSKMSVSIAGYTLNSTSTAYARVLSENTKSIAMVMQIIELRISAISIYLKCLTDIQQTLRMFVSESKAGATGWHDEEEITNNRKKHFWQKN